MRKSAVEKCLKEIDLGLLPELFVDGDHTIEAGMKALSALTAMRDRPSARALFKRHDGHRRNASGIRPFSQYSARLVGHRVR